MKKTKSSKRKKYWIVGLPIIFFSAIAFNNEKVSAWKIQPTSEPGNIYFLSEEGDTFYTLSEVINIKWEFLFNFSQIDSKLHQQWTDLESGTVASFKNHQLTVIRPNGMKTEAPLTETDFIEFTPQGNPSLKNLPSEQIVQAPEDLIELKIQPYGKEAKILEEIHPTSPLFPSLFLSDVQVLQEGIGNCYFMASLIALLQTENGRKAIEKSMFHLEEEHQVLIQIFDRAHRPYIIKISDKIPVEPGTHSKVINGMEAWWVDSLFKGCLSASFLNSDIGLAKISDRSYTSGDGGTEASTFNALVGKKAFDIENRSSFFLEKEMMKELITSATKKGIAITLATHTHCFALQKIEGETLWIIDPNDGVIEPIAKSLEEISTEFTRITFSQFDTQLFSQLLENHKQHPEAIAKFNDCYANEIFFQICRLIKINNFQEIQVFLNDIPCTQLSKPVVDSIQTKLKNSLNKLSSEKQQLLFQALFEENNAQTVAKIFTEIKEEEQEAQNYWQKFIEKSDHCNYHCISRDFWKNFHQPSVNLQEIYLKTLNSWKEFYTEYPEYTEEKFHGFRGVYEMYLRISEERGDHFTPEDPNEWGYQQYLKVVNQTQ